MNPDPTKPLIRCPGDGASETTIHPLNKKRTRAFLGVISGIKISFPRSFHY